MISVCTVTLEGIEPYHQIYLDSLCTKTKLVSEVFIAWSDRNEDYQKTWERNGIKFHEFGMLGRYTDGRTLQGLEHGWGMHECLDRCSNDLILFHDPDVFFYGPTDEFFLSLMKEHSLDVVGVSQHSATRYAYTFFPYFSCMLTKKSLLPPPDWLKDSLLGGKFLVRQLPSEEHQAMFPNPQGDFDTGSYLCLWAKLNNWRWMSFQTLDCHNHTTVYQKNNFKLKIKLPKQHLIYHATSSSVGNPVTLAEYKQAWQASNERQDDAEAHGI